MNKAIELLENLQIAHSGTSTTIDYILKHKKICAKNSDKFFSNESFNISLFFDQIIKGEIKLYSRYQNPLYYYNIHHIFQDIDEYMKSIDPKYSEFETERPIIGTLSINQISAYINKAKSTTSPIIILSDGVQNLANRISEIFLLALPFDSNNRLLRDFKVVQNNIEQYKLKQHMFILLNDIHNLKMVIPSFPIIHKQIELVGNIAYSFICFVASHEYSHFILGHHNKTKAPTQTVDGTLNMNSVLLNWNDELAADIIGSSITSIVLNRMGVDSLLVYLGIFLFMKVLNIQEKLNRTKKISPTHPSSLSRISEINKNFKVQNNTFCFFEDIFNLIVDEELFSCF